MQNFRCHSEFQPLPDEQRSPSCEELDLFVGNTPSWDARTGMLGLMLEAHKQILRGSRARDAFISVKQTSAFAQGVGFLEGDVIVAVDATPVHTWTEFMEAWTTARAQIEKVPVQFRVRRMRSDGSSSEADFTDPHADLSE
jgi:S1-C subfamily serine protease